MTGIVPIFSTYMPFNSKVLLPRTDLIDMGVSEVSFEVTSPVLKKHGFPTHIKPHHIWPPHVQPVSSVWNPEALSPSHPHGGRVLPLLYLLRGVTTMRGVVVFCWGVLKSNHHTTHFAFPFLPHTQHYQRFAHLCNMCAPMSIWCGCDVGVRQQYHWQGGELLWFMVESQHFIDWYSTSSLHFPAVLS